VTINYRYRYWHVYGVLQFLSSCFLAHCRRVVLGFRVAVGECVEVDLPKDTAALPPMGWGWTFIWLHAHVCMLICIEKRKRVFLFYYYRRELYKLTLVKVVTGEALMFFEINR